tara:strand:- start:10558 stop:10947 length:390 start_codon:yes stop_codon:yes gene_type:complete
MILITLNLTDINTSLQVGDLVYARETMTQVGASNPQTGPDASTGTGSNHLVGVLRKIEDQGGLFRLFVDNAMLAGATYTPSVNDFLMFSKYSQGDSGVLGYYARAKLVNNSQDKAEIFAVSSEIIINSK